MQKVYPKMRHFAVWFCLLLCLFLTSSAQAQVVSDTFMGTAATLLSAHTGETGATWTALAGNATTLQLNASNQLVATATTGASGYTASGSPAMADYDVQMDYGNTGGLGTGGNLGVVARAIDVNNLYWGLYQSNPGRYVIFKIIANTYTQIGTTTTLATPPTSLTLKFILRGTALTLLANGVSVATATDASLTAAGKAGIFGSVYGTVTMDNFVATNAPTATTIYTDNAAWNTSSYNHVLTGSGAGSVDTSQNVGWYKRIRYANSATAVLTFSAANSNAIIGVRFDGVGAWTKYTLTTTVTLTPPASRTAYHLLEICYLTQLDTQDLWTSNPPTGAIQFTGLVLDSGATVAAPTARSRNILTYNDSTGWGAWPLINSGNELTDCDVTTAYTWGLQTSLNANVGIVAFSGQKLNGASLATGSHIPALTTSYTLQWSGQARTFSPVPDLVIIGLGRNDGAGSNSAYQTALGGIIDGLVAAGVAASKILLVSDLDQYHYSDNQALAAAKGCAYLTALAFTGTQDSSDNVHPYAVFQQTTYLQAVTAKALSMLSPPTGGTKRKVQ